MDDYVRARYKRNKQLTILKITSPSGGMNPEMSAVDFIQDGDLNKSLKHFVRSLKLLSHLQSLNPLSLPIVLFSALKFWRTTRRRF